LKATGIVRRMDELGRIVVPMEIRRSFGIDNGDAVEIYVDGTNIILRKQEDRVCPHCQKKLEGEF